MTRCLLADDHPALLVAVADFLTANGVEVVATAAHGEDAIEHAARELPDVAVVDYRMPKLSGPDLVRRLTQSPGTKVIVYTADADRRIVEEALAAGAAGIVLKEAPLVDLLRAVEVVQAGRSYVDPALAALAIGSRNGTPRLTEREREVLALLADGLRHEEIGARLGISSETVRTHVQKACDRLDAATRTQAVATALRLGLIG